MSRCLRWVQNVETGRLRVSSWEVYGGDGVIIDGWKFMDVSSMDRERFCLWMDGICVLLCPTHV